ncbi:MAG: DUF2059 domain-containing protein [Desulfuromonadales bacterium]|nr:DUF2059 domain-containing protein [Desulfuromonadales bacterium]
MRLTFLVVLLIAVCTSNLAFGAATVFFKDGSREVGNSVWIEGTTVFLSKAKTIFEFTSDEVLMEETQKFNRIGTFSEKTTSDSRARVAEGAAPNNDLVEQLIKGSSFDRQIDQFIQQFTAGALSSAGENNEFNEILAQALAGFDASEAKQRIRAYYGSHLDSKTLQAIVAWTKSPLGLKVSEAQISNAVTSADMAQQILSDLEENPPSARLRALIQELDSAGRTTEMSLQLIVDAVSGAISSIPGKTSDKKKARREIIQKINQQKAEYEPQLRKMVQAGLIHTYADLSDGELREFIAFMRSDPARKFTKATMGALGEMTRTMSAAMTKRIVKAAERKMESNEQ